MMSRNRYSRANRWEELSRQESLIIEKKREIEQRLKATTTANDQAIEEKDMGAAKPTTSIPTHFKDEPPKIKKEIEEEKSCFVNRFQNDGSFLEMFRKMQQTSQQIKQEPQKENQEQPTPSPSSWSSTIKQEKADESSVAEEKTREEGSNRKDSSKEEKEFFNGAEHQTGKEREGPTGTENQTQVFPSEDSDIRLAIEKSAIYVAMNGLEAEAQLKTECQNDTDYRWLYQEGNVNHQYYKRRVEELQDAKTKATLVSSNDSIGGSGGLEEVEGTDRKGKRKKTSRWAEPNYKVKENEEEEPASTKNALCPQDTELVQYAIKVYGRCDLSPDKWKQLEDQRKMKILVEMMNKKRRKKAQFERAGKFNYEYDSDEEADGGTWEHKKRLKEMEKTKQWAETITEMNKGKHHIGDFLPPDQLEKFMKKWDSIKDGSTSLLFEEDYKDFKLQSENTGYKMLQKLGWSEGQGLGTNNQGMTKPIDSDSKSGSKIGLGLERPDELTPQDDEYEAYRKRMMLAYRFRPNPLNNPRRPYY